jgi:hypothetical protein
MELTAEERKAGTDLTFEMLKAVQKHMRLADGSKIKKDLVLRAIEASRLFVNDITDWE